MVHPKYSFPKQYAYDIFRSDMQDMERERFAETLNWNTDFIRLYECPSGYAQLFSDPPSPSPIELEPTRYLLLEHATGIVGLADSFHLL